MGLCLCMNSILVYKWHPLLKQSTSWRAYQLLASWWCECKTTAWRAYQLLASWWCECMSTASRTEWRRPRWQSKRLPPCLENKIIQVEIWTSQWGSEIRPFKIGKHLKSGLFEDYISNSWVLKAITMILMIWKLDHSKCRHFGFWQNGSHFSGFQMVGLSEFRSHLNLDHLQTNLNTVHFLKWSSRLQ